MEDYLCVDFMFLFINLHLFDINITIAGLTEVWSNFHPVDLDESNYVCCVLFRQVLWKQA